MPRKTTRPSAQQARLAKYGYSNQMSYEMGQRIQREKRQTAMAAQKAARQARGPKRGSADPMNRGTAGFRRR